MKQGYIIYHKAEGIKNQSFIEMFQKAGEAVGLPFLFVPAEEYRCRPLPSLVLNRTRKAQVSRWYEERQVMVYHDSELVETGNDKHQTLQFLQCRLPEEVRNRSWCPRSFLLSPAQMKNRELLRQTIRGKLGDAGTVVLKTVDGHGGSEVFRLPADPMYGQQQWEWILDRFSGRKLLCQEWVECGSRDLRVYVVWGEIYAAVLRQGESDFRSNYSLGGQVQPYLLSLQEERYIRHFIQAFGGERLAMAGLDFLLSDQEGLLFNELEEMVGSRMLYQCTSLDLVGDFTEALKKRM